MWIFYALLAGLFYTASILTVRHVLKKDQSDPWIFSFFYSAIGALVSLPFMLADIKVGNNFSSWALMLLVGVLIVVHNFFRLGAFKYISASLQEVITKTKLIWIMILGIIILNESATILKIIGTVLVVLAGAIVVNKLSKPKDMRGVFYALGATVFFAVTIILYKFLFVSFNSSSLTFFIFLIPAVINLFMIPNPFKRIQAMIKGDFKMVFIACALGGFANLATNQALAIGEASRVLVIVESLLVFTLIGEYFILKEEHEHLGIKIIAVILATAGAVLIRLS